MCSEAPYARRGVRRRKTCVYRTPLLLPPPSECERERGRASWFGVRPNRVILLMSFTSEAEAAVVEGVIWAFGQGHQWNFTCPSRPLCSARACLAVGSSPSGTRAKAPCPTVEALLLSTPTSHLLLLSTPSAATFHSTGCLLSAPPVNASRNEPFPPSVVDEVTGQPTIRNPGHSVCQDRGSHGGHTTTKPNNTDVPICIITDELLSGQ